MSIVALRHLKTSLKFKLLASFTLSMSLAFALTYRWFYDFATQQINRQTRQTLDRILDSTLLGIDGNDIRGLIQEAEPRADGHTDDNRYWALAAWLSLMESANPEAQLYVYTVFPENPNQGIYLGSGHSKTRFRRPGQFLQPYSVSQPLWPPGRVQRAIASHAVIDSTGQWLRGVTAIADSTGHPVAMLAIDYDATANITLQRNILYYLLTAFVISYSLLLLIIYLTSELLTRRIHRLVRWTDLVARGDYRNPLFHAAPAPLLTDELDTVAIAFQQMVQAIQEREQKLKESEATLEHQVEDRTAQLQATLRCEAAIRRINYKIHESLDEDHILKTAVEELGRSLGVLCCNTALYEPETRTAIVRQAYSETSEMALSGGRVGTLVLLDYWKIYTSLLAGQSAAFCSLDASFPFAIFACPILEDGKTIGDIWLFRSVESVYTDDEIELIEQVASCCLIAIRQARLYQQTQERLTEMEELHHLKDDFLSTVSHELRTPITNMRMASQMLKSFPLEPAKQARYLTILEEEVRREAELIEDLLDLQKLNARKMVFDLEPLDLTDCLPQLLEAFAGRLASRNLQLTLTLAPNLPQVACDRSAFKRVVSELLNNACKYTPEGEQVWLQAGQGALNQVVVSVTNSGVELPGGECDRIFDQFYRIPQSDRWHQGGTGLGLALVKNLMQQLGGRIEVSSPPNQVTFTLTFPQFVSD